MALGGNRRKISLIITLDIIEVIMAELLVDNDDKQYEEIAKTDSRR